MLQNKYGGQVECSCEVFPPKRNDDIYGIFKTLDEISVLEPDFISVTYGAGGSNSKKTATIASYIQNICEIPALAHMTAVGLTPELLQSQLEAFTKKKVKRILCLRGDKPRAMTEEEFDRRHFRHASDLITEVKKRGTFRIAAACYPEKHPESPDEETDVEMLKKKADCGADELITQMFFDNDSFYRFQERIEKAGISLPIHAGIMPITNARMLGTSVSLSGSSVPVQLSNLIAKYAEEPDDMKKAGTEYAIRQIDDLLRHGVYGIHIYSMNKSGVTAEIMQSLR